MIKLDIRGKLPSDTGKQDIQLLAEKAMVALGWSKDDESVLELLFVDEEEMRKLNNRYRNIDKPTDVLSFPQQQAPEIKSRILGSIVICDTIAKERNESTKELLCHGLLHLLGHDHEEDETAWDLAAKRIDCNL